MAGVNLLAELARVFEEHAFQEALRQRALGEAVLDLALVGDDGLDVLLLDGRKLGLLGLLARRGKVFKDRWLQKYFESLGWYKPDPKFREAALTAVEKKNVSAILAYEKKATSVLDAIEG